MQTVIMPYSSMTPKQMQKRKEYIWYAHDRDYNYTHHPSHAHRPNTCTHMKHFCKVDIPSMQTTWPPEFREENNGKNTRPEPRKGAVTRLRSAAGFSAVHDPNA